MLSWLHQTIETEQKVSAAELVAAVCRKIVRGGWSLSSRSRMRDANQQRQGKKARENERRDVWTNGQAKL